MIGRIERDDHDAVSARNALTEQNWEATTMHHAHLARPACRTYVVSEA